MNGYGWVSVIALAGWLVLAVGALRARQVGASKLLVVGLAWAAIFLLIALVFAAVQPR